MPKKDRCDHNCMEFEAHANENVVNEELQVKYDQHMKDKIKTRQERDKIENL